ncbi:alanine aminotransferase [Streptococcus pneumoniae]|nr:alanine aminotransferase [Streptococcus pneumoniae]
MRNKMIIAMSLVVAGVMTYLMFSGLGVMTYLMFSGLDEDFYHFPWKVFAGFGIMSWLVREGLKLVRDVKKEFEE